MKEKQTFLLVSDIDVEKTCFLMLNSKKKSPYCIVLYCIYLPSIIKMQLHIYKFVIYKFVKYI